MKSLFRPSRYPRGLPTLLVLAALSETVYIIGFLRQFPLVRYYTGDTDMGTITGHSHAGYDLFVGSITVSFVLLAFAWYHIHGVGDDRLVPWILATAAVFAVTLVFVYPITAIDIFAYVDQSWIMVHYHQNPIFVPPAAFPADPLMHLSDGWSGAGAPYGPLGLVIDALPVLVARGDLLWSLVLLKIFFSAMLLLSAYLVYRVLRQVAPGRALEGLVLVAWNPMVLFETSANGHNDIAMMVFALFALLVIVEGDLVFGVVLLAAACLIKFATLILLPLFVVYGLTRLPRARVRLRFAVLSFASSLAVATAAYARFWQGPDTLAHLVTQNQRYLDSFSSVVMDFGGPGVRGDQAALVGRVLFLCAYVVAIVLCTRDAQGFLRGCFLAMFAFLAFGLTNVESWYAIWPVLLAATVPTAGERLTGIVLAWGISLGAAFYGYEWWWRGLGTPGAFAYVNNKSYLLSFVPSSVALVLLAFWPRLGRALAGRFERKRPAEIGG